MNCSRSSNDWNARSGTKKALPERPTMTTYPAELRTCFTLGQGTLPFVAAICVVMPSAVIVRLRAAVLPRTKSPTGNRTSAPAVQARKNGRSLVVRPCARRPLASRDRRPMKSEKSTVVSRSLGDDARLRK